MKITMTISLDVWCNFYTTDPVMTIWHESKAGFYNDSILSYTKDKFGISDWYILPNKHVLIRFSSQEHKLDFALRHA